MPYPADDKPADWGKAIDKALGSKKIPFHARDFLRSVRDQCLGKRYPTKPAFITSKQIYWVKRRINEALGEKFWDNWDDWTVPADDDGVICPFDEIMEQS